MLNETFSVIFKHHALVKDKRQSHVECLGHNIYEKSLLVELWSRDNLVKMTMAEMKNITLVSQLSSWNVNSPFGGLHPIPWIANKLEIEWIWWPIQLVQLLDVLEKESDSGHECRPD